MGEMNKRVVRGASPVTIYCDMYAFEGLVIRLMLSIKGVNAFDMVNVNHALPSPELFELTLIQGLPVMSYKTSILEGLDVIMSFIEENSKTRNPVLVPDEPSIRAVYRMCIFRIVNFWQKALNNLANERDVGRSTAFLTEQFNEISIYLNKRYFNSNSITMVDVYLIAFIYMLTLVDFDYSGVDKRFIKYRNENVSSGVFLDALSDNEKKDVRFVIAKTKYMGFDG
ncbi:MAG: hypothetical protein QM504_03395 [Pseudomonadota bacterium]